MASPPPVDLSAVVSALDKLLNSSARECMPPAYTTPDPGTWLTYEKSFRLMADTSGWLPRTVGNVKTAAPSDKDLRGRQLLLAAMKGDAGQAVAHLEVSSFATIEDLLKRLRSIFVPAAQSYKVRADFRLATQTQGESLLNWHTRCRALFRQAFPGLDIETSFDLLLRFQEGLANRATAFHLQASEGVNTYNYSKLLERAQQYEAAFAQYGPTSGPSVNAIGHGHSGGGRKQKNSNGYGHSGSADIDVGVSIPDRPRKEVGTDTKYVTMKVPQFSWISKYASAQWGGLTCFFCRLPGHGLGECAGYAAVKLHASQKQAGGGQGQGSGRGGSRGGRGGRSGGGRGGKGGNGNRKLYAIEEQPSDVPADDDSPLFPEGN